MQAGGRAARARERSQARKQESSQRGCKWSHELLPLPVHHEARRPWLPVLPHVLDGLDPQRAHREAALSSVGVKIRRSPGPSHLAVAGLQEEVHADALWVLTEHGVQSVAGDGDAVPRPEPDEEKREVRPLCLDPVGCHRRVGLVHAESQRKAAIRRNHEDVAGARNLHQDIVLDVAVDAARRGPQPEEVVRVLHLPAKTESLR
mmetsp:Transcript_969/g.3444  ORF Transcript_969/g.3444 Transcript_969/m.3444 type:complete len:204 (+) Transcript_969:95-706(+)